MKALRFLAQGLASPARRNPQWFGLRRDGLSVRDRRLSSSTPMPIPKLKEVSASHRATIQKHALFLRMNTPFFSFDPPRTGIELLEKAPPGGSTGGPNCTLAPPGTLHWHRLRGHVGDQNTSACASAPLATFCEGGRGCRLRRFPGRGMQVTDQEKNILIWEYAEKPDYSLGIDDVYQLYHRGPHGKDALVQSAMFVKKLLPVQPRNPSISKP